MENCPALFQPARTVLVAALGLLAGACSRSDPPKGADPELPGTAAVDAVEVTNPDVAGTLKMMSAHAPLRAREVADAMSPTNRRILRTMVRKSMESQGGDPFDRPNFPQSRAPLVGSLIGKFSVDNKGAAKYVVSLPVPDGRGGLEPTLSVSYYSASGHGPLGRGFYVSTGFYEFIVPGRTILARDDVVRSKELDSRDFFYLDGKRLICVSAPDSYGKPGSEYRTEVDSFVRIHASGSGGDIETFTMVDRWGRSTVFGKVGESEDGLHRAYDEATNRAATKPLRFAVKRVTDPLGNYIAFSYDDKGFGDWVLARIEYTGGTDRRPEIAIEFHYVTREPRIPTYSAGLRDDSAQRLESIAVKAARSGDLLSVYAFEYARDDDVPVDHLTAIRPHLASEFGAPLEAAAPMQFHWSRGIPSERMLADLAVPPLPQSSARVGDALRVPDDFDGDGKTDLLTFDRHVSVALSTAAGFERNATQWLSRNTIDRRLGGSPALALHTADVDGDGRRDVLLVGSSGKVLPTRSDGQGFTPLLVVEVGTSQANLGRPNDSRNAQAVDWALRRVFPGDVNGDGRDDIIVFGDDCIPRYFRSQGDEYTALRQVEPIPAPAGPVAHYIEGLVEDLNNDGCDDFAWLERAVDSAGSEQMRLSCRIIEPDGNVAPLRVIETWPANAEPPAVALADFNDDGLPDFLTSASAPVSSANGSRRWTAFLNRGVPTGSGGAGLEMFTRIDDAIATGASGPVLEKALWSPRAVPAAEDEGAAIIRVDSRLVLGRGDRLSTLDVNDDTRVDLVWFAPQDPKDSSAAPTASADWWACHGRGDGTFGAPVRVTGRNWNALRKAAELASGRTLRINNSSDYNGDGAFEWTLESGDRFDQSSVLAALSPSPRGLDGGPFDVVTVFVDGMGESVHVRYKAARDDSVYTPGAPVVHPMREIRPARPVVSDIWRDTGGDGYSQFSYQYSGHRLDLSGRGPLGFASFTTIDRQTRFLKYQHLAHSYPLTGLTTREETHWYWSNNGLFLFKCISAEDHAVVCDFVVDPSTRAPYGTLLPFVDRTVDSRWRADLVPDSTVRPQQIKHLENITQLFAPSQQPTVEQTTTTTWRDLQDHTQPPPAAYPRVRVPYVLDVPYTGARPRVSEAALQGSVTHGNETRRLVSDEAGKIEDTVETFRTPRDPSDPLTSLRETRRTVTTEASKEPVPGPLTTYRYFADTTLKASETVDRRQVGFAPAGDAAAAAATERSDAADSEEKETATNDEPVGDEAPVTISETVYERDGHGRLVRRIERTWIGAGTAEPPNEEVAYEAFAFDDATDQPTRIVDREDGERTIHYYPFLRHEATIDYGEAGTVDYKYDGYGRTIRAHNPTNGYLRTTEYAWTTWSSASWRKTQIVAGPAEAGGIAIASVYAERTSKRGGSTVTKYRDRLGRVIRVTEENKDGVQYADTAFALLKRIAAESKPYVPGETQTWTVHRYDSYGNEFPTREVTVAPQSHPPAAAQ